MPSIFVDSTQLSTESISTEDTDGTEIEDEFVIIPVLIATADVASWLSLYDELDNNSPSETDSRIVARCILNALKAATA